MPPARHFPQKVLLSYLAPEQTQKMPVAVETPILLSKWYEIVLLHASTIHTIPVCEEFVNATDCMVRE